MTKLKKVIAIALCLVAVFSSFNICAYAANYTSRYSNYDSPEDSGDWAQYKNGKVKRSSSTKVDEVKWMQAALNYCMDAEGLNKLNGYNVSKLDVDGSFGPASKKATEVFQKAAGLKVDGSFGPSTIKKMKSILNDKITYSLVPTTAIRRPTTSTTTTTTKQTTTANTFKQQNILQYYAPSSSNYISGDWYSYKGNGKYDDTISSSGCGIVALISAVYNLGGTIEKKNIGTAIKDVFDWAYGKYWTDYAHWTLFTAADDKFGEKYHFYIDKQHGSKGTANTDLSALVNHLKNNKGTAVVHVNNHFMAAVGYKVENGVEKIHIFDPSPGGRRGNYTDKTNKDGAWIELSVLKEGSVKSSLNHQKYLKTVSQENIEIDAYWLVFKK